MSKVKEVRFTVFGKPWTMRLMKRRSYNKKNGKDTLAMTYRLKHRIDISPNGVDLETITHEVVHAYVTELCLSSAEISVESMEEIFCELIAKHGTAILATARELHRSALDANTAARRLGRVC